MYGTYFYYLSSFFNLFLCFFKSSDFSLFFALLVIIKISFCGFSMYFYLSHKFKSNNFVILAFSLCYAFMGYNLNYYINIMWLDVVMLAPIVIFGIDKIIEKNSPFIYILFLFISIFSNYYLAYMLCIFCVMYFIYEILLKYDLKKDKVKIFKLCKIFIFSSLLCGFMCSFLLIPCFLESISYSRGLSFSDIMTFNFNFFDLFSRSYIGAINTSDIVNYSSMNVYCGIVTIPLVYIYLTNNAIDKKEKFLTLFFIIMLILPCFIFPFNYFWHLFSKPSYYCYRYSFLLCFFLINVAYKSYLNLNISKKYIIIFLSIYFLISFYFVILSLFSNYYSSLSFINIFITFLFLILYIVVLFLKNKNFRCILFTIMLFVDSFFNTFLIFNNYKKNDASILSHDFYSEIDQKYFNDGRIVFFNSSSLNDSLLIGYSGISSFLSTSNSNSKKFLSKMSYVDDADDNIFVYSKGIYTLDSLLGIKYIVSDSILNNYDLLESINYNNQTFYVYSNPNALSLGYVINDKCNNIDFSINFDQEVFNCILGNNHNYYNSYDINVTDDGYSAVISDPHNFFIYYPGISNLDIQLNNKNLLSVSNNFLIFENYINDYVLKFKVYSQHNLSYFKVFYFDYNKFSLDVNKYIKEQLDYKIYNNKIIGNISTKGGIMMLTIPYVNGYNICVDGKKTDYFKVLDTFVGIDLSEGNHNIEISYVQPGFYLGILLSIISFLIFLVYILYFRYIKKNK